MEDSQTRKTTTYSEEFCRADANFFGIPDMNSNMRKFKTQNLVTVTHITYEIITIEQQLEAEWNYQV